MNKKFLDFAQKEELETLRQGADAEGGTATKVPDPSFFFRQNPRCSATTPPVLCSKKPCLSAFCNSPDSLFVILQQFNTSHANMENGKDGLNILGHELGHSYGAKTEAESDLHSEKLKNAVNQENKYNGYSVNTSWEGARDWGAQNQNVLDQGNSKLAQVGGSDKRLRIINEGKEILGADWIKQEYKIDVTKAGDYVQKIPGPVLDIAGITLAPIALSAGLLGAPAIETAVLLGGVGLAAASVSQTFFEYEEGHISKKQATISTGLNSLPFFVSRAPLGKFAQYNISKTLFVGQKMNESNKKQENKTNNQ